MSLQSITLFIEMTLHFKCLFFVLFSFAAVAAYEILKTRFIPLPVVIAGDKFHISVSN